MKQKIENLYSKQVPFCIVLALVLNLFIEILSKRNIITGFLTPLTQPLVYLSGAAIIFSTLLISGLFRRRSFSLAIISCVWLGLSIADFVVRCFRSTPLGAIDLKIIKSAISMMQIYMSIFEAILLFAAIAALLVCLGFVFFRAKKEPRRFIKALIEVLAGAGAMAITLFVSIQVGSLATRFTNLPDAYRDYGFVYCFSCSVVNTGIPEPDEYSPVEVGTILNKIHANAAPSIPAVKPNIIMLQLESFFDVTYMKDIQWSSDPLPTFRYLKDNYDSGGLFVPYVGAGTANTEFEIMTGMNLDYFGPGEYPYKTVLQSATCESVCYNLGKLGYTSHAIHNNTAAFYDRYEVFPRLGFDSFTPIEAMNGVHDNILGWAEDDILRSQITDALASTPERDYIYTISVQGHGKYPTEQIDPAQTITAEGFENHEQKASFEYYANQIYEMDGVLARLLEQLADFPEPTVLVVYGDHLPALGIENEMLTTNATYRSEYAIWTNYSSSGGAKYDLEAYQLSAYVMQGLGMNTGVLTRLHQELADDPRYLEYLEILEYDMLYGDYISLNGTPYKPKDMTIGVYPATIESVEVTSAGTLVHGKNFTPYSSICVDGDAADTSVINSSLLIAPDFFAENNAQITVQLVNGSDVVLSESAVYAFTLK